MRLANQLIERPASGDESAAVAIDPPDVVRHLCAMQAQDYAGSLWSVGLRSGPDCTAADVERAIAERRIVRTWPMRGTLHLLAPEDVRWMLALLSPRVLARARGRHEQLGITESTIERARAISTDALSGGRVLTRAEMMALLEAEGLDTTGQRGYHVLWTLAQQAVLCCGPIAGKQQTFVLLDEWVPPSETEPPLKLEAALGHLAKRYFEARGPATIADFAWWAGIRKAEARDGVESAGPGLRRDTTGGTEYWVSTESGPEPAASVTEARPESRPVHLLPGFDEYFLGYTDRSLQLDEHREAYGGTVSANGMFSATLIISGRVAGTWKRTLRRDRVDITVRAFRPLTSAEMSGLADAAARYGRFLGLEANVLV